MNTLPYAQLMRLRLLDMLLVQYGTINRSVLEDYFGISTPQASMDIRKYMELAPHNIEYDKSARTYRRTDAFVRLWL